MSDAPLETRLALIREASLAEQGDALAVTTPPTAHRPPLRFPGVGPGLRAALEKLRAEGGAALSELAAPLMASEGPAGFGRLQHAVSLLDRCALLDRTLVAGGEALATLHPLSTYYRHRDDAAAEGGPWTLSRFACLRRDAQALLLETPLGHASLRLESPRAAAALHALARPCDAAGLAEASGLDADAAAALLALLANAAALTQAGSDGPAEDARPELGQWDFHDLLFHSRSRLGRHANGFGGTFRFQQRFAALPAHKPPMSEQLVELQRPDLDARARSEPSFSEVLESRRSLREYGAEPITADQLSELLYRAARVQKQAPDGAAVFRPFPAGGALHELEIYPVVGNCRGLEPALYRYDAVAHRLEKLAARQPFLDALLQMAVATADLKAPPQVLLVIAARFQRVQWKYESMAYALVLKHVGVLYQTLYLVATAMGLAPCALGGGHSDLFAQAAGLEYTAETSVGEFILGSRA